MVQKTLAVLVRVDGYSQRIFQRAPELGSNQAVRVHRSPRQRERHLVAFGDARQLAVLTFRPEELDGFDRQSDAGHLLLELFSEGIAGRTLRIPAHEDRACSDNKNGNQREAEGLFLEIDHLDVADQAE